MDSEEINKYLPLGKLRSQTERTPGNFPKAHGQKESGFKK